MTATHPIVGRLALIGVGLIGGSIARAARKNGTVREIVATARSEATRRRVIELGIADQVVETNAEAVKDADLVIVCIPVGASGSVAAEIAGSLKPGAIVSDVGSVKGQVLKDMAPHIPQGVHLIPAHPVAGTENSGPDSGFAELFINRWCILTPPEDADPQAVEKLRVFWTALGANTEIMRTEHHDLVLGITSHLPHLLAFAIVGTANELSSSIQSNVLDHSSDAFRIFTRIAASDPSMWRDVFLCNKHALFESLGTFNEDLSNLTRSMRAGDRQTLLDQFRRIRDIRNGIVHLGQDAVASDFKIPPALPGHLTLHAANLLQAARDHLPRLIAYTIVNTASDLNNVFYNNDEEHITSREVLTFSAGGFRDFTRIAASSPEPWPGIFLTNQGAVLEVLGRFREYLALLTRPIRSGDSERLFSLLSHLRAIRRSIPETTKDEDFSQDLKRNSKRPWYGNLYSNH